jgi:hypothetical protein
MYQPNQSPEGVQIQMIRLVAAWGLIMMVSVLVAWGWSIQHAVIGLFWGVCLALIIYSIGSSWNASGLGKRPDTELWRYGASVADADLLTKTVSDFSEWNANSRTGIDMAVVGVQSPALRWALRNMSNVEYLDSLPAGKNPSVVITSAEENLAQTVPYTGQGFIWSQNPALTLLFPGEWMHWLAVRDMPTEKQSLILWIRGDKFPGSAKIKSVNLTP